ncbi:MAG: hypothetical protein KCHDKBKB_00355 [Elusimicrobia bacterium]|nr:hypothetical protein [Elusimicrobiota bacterium]
MTDVLAWKVGDRCVMEKTELDRLIAELTKDGYTTLGPTVRDGAIVYDNIGSMADLPEGWTDEQEAATYRLKKRNDKALFGYVVGPHSWKKYLFPPTVSLMQIDRNEAGLAIKSEPENLQRFAFIGVRACELNALAIQDQVFLGGAFVDPIYKSRRDGVFIVAVNCSQAGKTCFCVSMNTGPKATAGFDLALTEMIGEGNHRFLIEMGTERGALLMSKIECFRATEELVQKGEKIVEQTAQQMGRTMNTQGIKDLLYQNLEHARWNQVAERCLSCANCTMVCPTCFCSTVEDVTDLTGDHAERVRKWDSCFTQGFSYTAAGVVRPSVKSRYRQWMTHKLATWIDQFGSSGCVGCGRCITWCPVGIDITQEVAAIRGEKKNSR